MYDLRAKSGLQRENDRPPIDFLILMGSWSQMKITSPQASDRSVKGQYNKKKCCIIFLQKQNCKNLTLKTCLRIAFQLNEY